ncbi:hypothetical protein C9374_010009 [Naegleria lovaniensis]|uniref:Uncharacterized protein n=1 Tax=Naegleria lovaniensis TaxID=51637 RepID=A0AA88GF33_NAELO|nr:uncharacterized protein C9374_010009 [Naegleria lovaniensis]KAG2375386.1 hypothetical protein C9374_010009 [Naegleria lovaniensis]
MLRMNCCCYQCAPLVDQALQYKNLLYYGSSTKFSPEFDKMYRNNKLKSNHHHHEDGETGSYGEEESSATTTTMDPSHVFEIYVPMMDENVFGGLPSLFDKETYPLTYLGNPKSIAQSEEYNVATEGTEDQIKFVFNSEAYRNSLFVSNNSSSGDGVSGSRNSLNEEDQKELLRQIVYENIEQHEWRYCISNINAGISHSFPCPGKIGTAIVLSPFTCGLSFLPIFLFKEVYVMEAMRRIDTYLGKVNKKLYDRAIEKKLDYYLQFQVIRKEHLGISWVQVNAISTKKTPSMIQGRFVTNNTNELETNPHVSRPNRFDEEEEFLSDEEMHEVELK